MLIGALVVLAAALLVSAFLTGTTALAGAALVVSLITAVLYVMLLRRPVAAGSSVDSDASETEASAEEDADEATPEGDAEDATPAEATTPTPADAETTTETEPATPAVATSEPVTSESETPAVATPAAEPAVAKPAAGKPAVSNPEPAKPAAVSTPGTEVVAPTAGAIDRPEPEIDGAAVVHVVPGRMRYHVDGCQVLDGQDAEALTVDDARDEGFTACSRCAVRGRTTAKA